MTGRTLNPNDLLMPTATAVWLIDNTTLTFGQIAVFTGLHEIEVEALADGTVGKGIEGRDPVAHNELTLNEIRRCEADGKAALKKIDMDLPPVQLRAKGPKYTPVSKRSDKPDAIAWVLKHHPEIADSQICRLIGTTKPTIAAIRDRSHPSSAVIKPRHPAEIGLCSYAEIETASRKGFKAQGKDPDKIAAEKAAALEQQQSEQAPKKDKFEFAGFDVSSFFGAKNTGTDKAE